VPASLCFAPVVVGAGEWFTFFLGVRWGGGAVWHAHWQCKQLVAAAEYHVQTSSASQLLWQCCT
jgi:hypothetical protein